MSDVMLPPFSGNYSRSTFVEQKRYLGMLQQQGKPVVDADLIEHSQIQTGALQRALHTAFPSGGRGDSFKVVESASDKTNNFALLARNVAGIPAVAVDPESYARYFVRGLGAQLSDGDVINEYREYSELGGSDVLRGELHHRSTSVTDGILIDAYARFVPGELVGQQLVPNVVNGVAFAITANTANTITVTVPNPGDMVAAAQVGDYYRIIPSAPVSERYDIVWLDVYIGEMGSAEDADLIHPLGAGLEASRRFVLRQQVRYSQLQPAQVAVADAPGVVLLVDPAGVPVAMVRSVFVEPLTDGDWLYTDLTGVVHYATPLAVIRRNSSSITNTQITDLRNPEYGSSREVIAARAGFANLGDRLDSLDVGLGDRRVAQATQLSVSRQGPTNTNVVQIGGETYVGETPSDTVTELVKLYTPDGLSYLKGVPPSIVSSVNLSGGITFVAAEALIIHFDGVYGPITTNFGVGTYTLDAVIAAINAAIALYDPSTSRGVATKTQGRYLAIQTNGGAGRSASVRIGGSASVGDLFSVADQAAFPYPGGELFADILREPKLRGIKSDLTFAYSAIGGPDFPATPTAYTKYFTNAVFEFDQILPASAFIARFGMPVAFENERGDSPTRRGTSDRPVQEDYRLDNEHYLNGEHKDDIIKDRHIDWGSGANQVDDSDVPHVPSGAELVAVSVKAAIDELEAYKVSLRSGSPAAHRTMLAELFMGSGATRNKIRMVGDPLDSYDAVNKLYVDTRVAGIILLDAVRVATTTAGTLASSFENGDTIDGVVLATNDRILIKNQASAIENGVYIVNATGAPTRDVRLDGDETVTTGTYVYVQAGSTHAYQTWVLSTPSNPQIGVAANNWSQFSSAANLSPGAGLVLTGPVLDVGEEPGAQNPVRVAADYVYLDTSRLVDSTNSGLEAVNSNRDIRITNAFFVTGGGLAGGSGAQAYVARPDLIDPLKGLKVTGTGASAKIEVAIGAGLAFDMSGNLTATTASVAYVPTNPADWPNPDPTTIQSALDKLAAQRSLIGHVHGSGGEAQIVTTGIADEAITGAKIFTPFSNGLGINPAAAGVVTESYWRRAGGKIWPSHQANAQPGNLSSSVTAWPASIGYGGNIYRDGVIGSPGDALEDRIITNFSSALVPIWIRSVGDLTINKPLRYRWDKHGGAGYTDKATYASNLDFPYCSAFVEYGGNGAEDAYGASGGGGGAGWGAGGSGANSNGGVVGGYGAETIGRLSFTNYGPSPDRTTTRNMVSLKRVALDAALCGPKSASLLLGFSNTGGTWGGRAGNFAATVYPGGNGGAIVVLEVGGVLTIDAGAYIDVSGGAGAQAGSGKVGGAGGGGGGIILIYAQGGINAPAEAFRVNGGNGSNGVNTAGGSGGGGGGGGGGVAVVVAPNFDASWFKSGGGTGGLGAGGAGVGGAGGAGMVRNIIGLPSLMY